MMGTQTEGNYINDEKDGEFKISKKNGEVIIEEWKDGVLSYK
jgi:hypothetical protein